MTTFGIVSPARWCKPEWLESAKAIIEARGHKVFIHPQNNLRAGRLAGSDQERAVAFMDIVRDSYIDVVLAARGGSGCFRIVDLLDWKVIKDNPKIYCGFSDITTLLNAIHVKTGLVTHHGPVAATLSGSDVDPRSADDFFAALTGKKSEWLIEGTVALRAGKAEGKLVGGNLTLLQNLIGTPYDWSGEGAILFFEDVNEELYRIDRTLWHFKLAGKFRGLKGVIAGEMKDMHDGIPDSYGKSFEQILLDVFPDVPIVTGFPCGHGRYNTTLPVGARVGLNVEQSKAQIKKI
jgi:muramoyltetrapeptide carboxypeptidase